MDLNTIYNNARSTIKVGDHLYENKGRILYAKKPLGRKFTNILINRTVTKLITEQSLFYEESLLNLNQKSQPLNLNDADNMLYNSIRKYIRNVSTLKFIDDFIYNSKGMFVPKHCLWNNCCFIYNYFNSDDPENMYCPPKYKFLKDRLDNKSGIYLKFKSELKSLKKYDKCNYNILFYIFKFYMNLRFTYKTPRDILKFIRLYYFIGRIFGSYRTNKKGLIMNILDTQDKDAPNIKLLEITGNNIVLNLKLKLFNEDLGNIDLKCMRTLENQLNILLREKRLNTQKLLRMGSILSLNVLSDLSGFNLVFILKKEFSISKVLYNLKVALVSSLIELLNIDEVYGSNDSNKDEFDLKGLKNLIRNTPELTEYNKWICYNKDNTIY